MNAFVNCILWVEILHKSEGAEIMRHALEESENSGDLEFIKITYVWVHAWCSVFRFLVALTFHWTKLSLSR